MTQEENVIYLHPQRPNNPNQEAKVYFFPRVIPSKRGQEYDSVVTPLPGMSIGEAMEQKRYTKRLERVLRYYCYQERKAQEEAGKDESEYIEGCYASVLEDLEKKLREVQREID